MLLFWHLMRPSQIVHARGSHATVHVGEAIPLDETEAFYKLTIGTIKTGPPGVPMAAVITPDNVLDLTIPTGMVFSGRYRTIGDFVKLDIPIAITALKTGA